MAVIETFEFILSVVESGIIEEAIIEVQSYPEVFAAAESSQNLKTSITDHLETWKSKIKKQIMHEPVNTDLNSELEQYQDVVNYTNDQFIDEIEDIVANMDINSPFHEQANTLLEEQKNRFNPLFKHYFCEQWHQSLFDNLQASQAEKLDKEKELLLEDLYQRLDTIKQLTDIDEGASDQKNLRLWDMAKAKLKTVDVSNLKKSADYLKNNETLQEIARKLGRMAHEANEQDQSEIEMEDVLIIEKVTNEVAEDIVGIHESDELERLLPAEMLYLAYPELEVIFYKHLADKRLATYQLQGKTRTVDKVITKRQQKAKADQPKGPFIIAVDASGSMMGLPETTAKAFAYALMQIAMAEDRHCYVIIFSANQITYELTGNDGLSEVLSFLSYSFNGGTDLTPVLEKSIELMNSEKYINADLVVISDFISPPQQQTMNDKIVEIKENKNRFHAVSLSKYGNPELLKMFDHYWEFHPTHLGQFKNMFKKW